VIVNIGPGLPDFSRRNLPKLGKIYQMAICRMQQPFPFQGPPKFTLNGIFGLKIYYPTTLLWAVTLKITYKYQKF
jgi:hypothetical protein